MIKLDQIREHKLIELAKTHFASDSTEDKLTEAELKVLHDSATSEDLPEPDDKAPRPVVRAAFLRWLATDPEAAPHIDPKGLRVYAATIPGQLDLEGSHISVRLDFRCCTAKDEINLEQAETQEILFWDSALEGLGSFRGDTSHVHGMLHLKNSVFHGKISLGGAKIESDLDCTGVKLEGKEEVALFADGAEIGGDVFLREGFECHGTIRLVGAKITGDISCLGAKLIGKTENALLANGIEIGGNATFGKSFQSSGKISLRGGRIGGQIEFFDAILAQVDCTNLNSAGDLYWMGIGQSNAASLDLRGATVKNLREDEDSWPQKGHLYLNGLNYGELTLHSRPTADEITHGTLPQQLKLDAGEGTRKRIQWLMRQPDDQCIKPQPWMQLSQYLDTRGQHRAAKHVLYEQKCMQARDRWKGIWLTWRWWAIAFAWLEEAPGRIWRSIAVVLLLGWLVFGYAGSHRALAPTEAEAYKAFTSNPQQPLPGTYPKLNSFVYTLENAVPLAKLGQDEKWAPDHRYNGTNWFTNYWFLMWFRWLLILSGWAQATVLAAALSGRFKP